VGFGDPPFFRPLFAFRAPCSSRKARLHLRLIISYMDMCLIHCFLSWAKFSVGHSGSFGRCCDPQTPTPTGRSINTRGDIKLISLEGCNFQTHRRRVASVSSDYTILVVEI
jgi:hypothetical protein